jgi:hypothetical protein
MNIQRSTLACAAALAASISATYAGPCSDEIAQVQGVIDARIHAKASDATGPVPARTRNQPTPGSVAAAEVELGQTSPEVFDAVKTLMARAIAADDTGDKTACEQALTEVNKMFGQ